MKIIVSDKFSKFASETDSLTFECFISNVKQLHGETIVIGQGLSILETNHVVDIANNNKINIVNITNILERASHYVEHPPCNTYSCLL